MLSVPDSHLHRSSGITMIGRGTIIANKEVNSVWSSSLRCQALQSQRLHVLHTGLVRITRDWLTRELFVTSSLQAWEEALSPRLADI